MRKPTIIFRTALPVGARAVVLLVSAIAIESPIPSFGTIIVGLTNNNSIVLIDPSHQTGMFDWRVGFEGDYQGYPSVRRYEPVLNQQGFWYRVGNNPERSIDGLGIPTINQPNDNSVSLRYGDSQLDVEVRYELFGGPFVFPPTAEEGVTFATSSLLHTLIIRNLTASPLDYHLILYAHFRMANQFQLFEEPGGNTHLYQGHLGYFTISGFAPVTSLFEIGESTVLLNKLNDGDADDFTRSIIPSGSTAWAVQWDLTISSGSAIEITNWQYVELALIPEPSIAPLIPLGLGLLALRRCRLD